MNEVRSPRASELSIAVDDTIGEVSGLLLRPRGASWLYLMAHGAGAGMRHEFMEAMAGRLYHCGIATLRYQFPYMEAGRKRPDHKKRLLATVRAAVATARRKVRLPLVAGGKSMGGRMTSMALAEAPNSAVSGLLFLGFPLHAAGKPGSERAEHLREIAQPMLFVQGTRDALADLELMTGLHQSLTSDGAEAELHIVEHGDHSFRVPKRTGISRTDVLDQIAEAIAEWGTRW